MRALIKTKGIAALLLAWTGLLAGCASDAASPAAASASAFLSPAEADQLIFMREEEKLARDVYLDLAEFWGGRADGADIASVMGQIASSEQRHMDRLKALLDAYGLNDPVDPVETRGRFLNPDLARLYLDLTEGGRAGRVDAWTVGALIEDKDILDLQVALAGVTQDAVRAAYDSLACGSRNHLRSFSRQLAAAGAAYTARFLPQATVDAIIASGNERCGG
jgi:hypothetical protein